MGLFGKEPVINPCEADSFEEAALKNRLRLNHERNGCTELHEEMKAKGEPGLEGYDPAFWTGAVGANEAAFRIYQDEYAAMRKLVAGRLVVMMNQPNIPDSEKSGWRSILENWQNALEKNSPSVIVYW